MNKSLDMEKAIKKMQKEMKRFNTSSMKLDKNFNAVTLKMMKEKANLDKKEMKEREKQYRKEMKEKEKRYKKELKDMGNAIKKMQRQMKRQDTIRKKNEEKITSKYEDIIKDIQEEVKKIKPKEVKQYDFKIVVFKLIDENEINEYPSRQIIKHNNEHYVARKSMSLTTTESVEQFVNKKISDKNVNWETLIDILKTDQQFADYYENFVAYINLIIVKNYTETVINIDNKHNPIEDFLNADNDNKRMFSQFIEYDINTKADSFGDLFNVKLSDYVISNFKANSCFLTAIVNHFKPSFDQLKKGVRQHCQLTYESLCNLLQIEDNKQDIGLSIKQSMKFFEKYRFSLMVINVFGQVLFYYRPDKLNQNHKTTFMRMIVHYNHCYPIIDNIHKFDAYFKCCVNNIEWNDVDNLTISDKYQFRNTEDDDIDIYYVNNLDDVTEIMRTFKSLNVKVRFVTSNDLTSFLFKMIENKYTPLISVSGGNIQSLMFKLKINKVNVMCSVQSCDINVPLDNNVYIDNVKTYKKYLNIDNKFYNSIMDKDNISEFDEDSIQTELEYNIGPTSGYFLQNS